jgi:predicted nucleotidyltransferase
MLLNKELRILEEFTSGKEKKVYGRLLAKKLKQNQKTISNLLNNLEKEDILKFRTEGKNKYYFLNEVNPLIKEIINLVEINKKILFLKKNVSLIPLFEELEKRTEGILAVFGSYASGKNIPDSDLDIFLIGKIKDVSDLEESFSIKINVIKSNSPKFDSENNFIKELMKNHIILKRTGEFRNLWFR